jgi:hypothetical protein
MTKRKHWTFAAGAVLVAGLPVLAPGAARAQMLNCQADPGNAACQTVGPHAVPVSEPEFVRLINALGKTPQGGAALFLHALLMRIDDPIVGTRAAASRLGKRLALSGKPLAGAKYHFKRLDDRPHCVRSYVAGTTPKGGYKYDATKVRFLFRKQTRHVGSVKSGRYKVFVCSSGAATCRPITLVRDDEGQWLVDEFSTLSVDCIKPSK